MSLSCLGCAASMDLPGVISVTHMQQSSGEATLFPVLQVVSVPFYTWQAAGSLEDRQAYLEHLLSLGTSSLPFDEATGLLPLQAVQQKWQQGVSSLQLANGGAAWQASPSQDSLQVEVRSVHCMVECAPAAIGPKPAVHTRWCDTSYPCIGQANLWHSGGEPAPALLPGLPPLAASSSRPLSQPSLRSQSGVLPDSLGMGKPRSSLASAGSGGSGGAGYGSGGAGYLPLQPPPPPPRLPSVGPPPPDAVPRVGSVDGRMQWLGSSSDAVLAGQQPAYASAANGHPDLRTVSESVGLHGSRLQHSDNSGSIGAHSRNFGSLHTARSGLSRFSSQSSGPIFGGSGKLQYHGSSARAMSGAFGSQGSGRLPSGHMDEEQLSEKWVLPCAEGLAAVEDLAAYSALISRRKLNFHAGEVFDATMLLIAGWPACPASAQGALPCSGTASLICAAS